MTRPEETLQKVDSQSALRHLLISFPELHARSRGANVVDMLVEGAVANLLLNKAGPTILTAEDVIRKIRQLTTLEYRTAEVVEAFIRLAAAGALEFRDESKRSIMFSAERHAEVVQQIQARSAQLSGTIDQWGRSIGEAYGLSLQHTQEMSAALDRLVASVCHHFSAEAAALLYSGSAEGSLRFQAALDDRIPDVEAALSEPLREIGRVELRKFFQDTNEERRAYLVDRLNAAFFFHLLSIDPGASALVREQFENKVLYLDTNVLYGLLNLKGPTQAYPANLVIATSNELGIQLRVARETVSEFIRSLRAETQRLRATPILSEDYQRIAAEHPSDEWAFMREYFRLRNSGQLKTIDEFERRFTQIEAYLESWDISIDEDAVLTDEIQAEESFRERVILLDRWTRYQKSERGVRHDVFLPLVIRKRRGGTAVTPARAREWFVTFDRRLAPFEIHHPVEPAEVAPCVRVEDWIQVIRPFLPRTAEYEAAFSAMLSEPVLYLPSDSGVPLDHKVEALSRLEAYEPMPPAVVAGMVADSEFIRRFLEAESSEEEKNVIELGFIEISAALTEQNERLRADLHLTSEQLTAAAQRETSLSERLTEIERRADAEKTARVAAELGAERLVEDIREQRNRADAQIDGLYRRHQEEIQTVRASFRRLAQWLVFGVSELVVIVGGTAAWFLWVQDWLATAQTLYGLGVALVCLSLFMIPFGPGWIGILSLLVGIAGLAISLISGVS
jgi:hypothetical protein